eukprot:CAMPEP_0115398280 /NCGR_PEP_ID=MMETSP0271-20121206/14240_1 /TAXON_ID=71861 /ORGANISM="Scrippsiella trochoidea, Strain CCMP3099" /LENGTH=569 /DNA_ID=CAMNT_0002822057 /DNA_START=1 /DNA_END=1712 /DNA_ORIENTATION=+
MEQHRDSLEASKGELQALRSLWEDFNSAIARQCSVVEGALTKKEGTALENNVYVLNFDDPGGPSFQPSSPDDSGRIHVSRVSRDDWDTESDTSKSSSNNGKGRAVVQEPVAQLERPSLPPPRHSEFFQEKKQAERGIAVFRRVAQSDGFNWWCMLMSLLNAIFCGIQANADVIWAFQNSGVESPGEDETQLGGRPGPASSPKLCSLHASGSSYSSISALMGLISFLQKGGNGVFLTWLNCRLDPRAHVIEFVLVLCEDPSDVAPREACAVAQIREILPQFTANVRLIAESLIALFWALSLMFLLMYVVGVMMLQGVALHVESTAVETRRLVDFAAGEGGNHLKVLNDLYGNFGRVMMTLYRALTGGDWMDFAAPMSAAGGAGWWFSFLWVVYIGLMFFCFLNILTGVFVDIAMKKAESDHASAENEKRKKEEEEYRRILRTEFPEVDMNTNGMLSHHEFKALVHNDKVVTFITGLGIDVSRFGMLFKVLDRDNSGQLTVDEVVEGTFRMKTQEKDIDMLALLNDTNKRLETMMLKANKMKNHVSHMSSTQKPKRRPPKQALPKSCLAGF